MGLSVAKTVTVDVDVDLDDDEIIEALNDKSKEYLIRLAKLSAAEVTFDGVSAEQAYYAMHRGDTETVRRFVCGAAGRIA